MQSTFRYDVHAGTAGDAYVDTGILQFIDRSVSPAREGVTRIVEMAVWDAAAYIALSYDGITFGDAIELDQDDPPIQIPHAVRSFQIMNRVPGANSRYQIIGFW